MFDVGFSELVLVAVVALLVVGPERLPGLARTVGLWLGRGRRMIASVKQDIDRELKAEELKRILAEQNKGEPLHRILEDTREALNDVRERTETALKPGDNSGS
jgi:sec-independent protein translocase protein TatB